MTLFNYDFKSTKILVLIILKLAGEINLKIYKKKSRLSACLIRWKEAVIIQGTLGGNSENHLNEGVSLNGLQIGWNKDDK